MRSCRAGDSTPPQADLQFNIGSTPDSLERVIELSVTADVYRVFVPSRRSWQRHHDHSEGELWTRQRYMMQPMFTGA